MVLQAGRGKRRPAVAGWARRRDHWYRLAGKRAMLGHLARFPGGALSGPQDAVVASASLFLSTWHLPVTTMRETDFLPLLQRIADALERLAPSAATVNDLSAADAFV